MKYGVLPDMYVIFICMFDPFGKGLAQGREEMISAIRYLTDNGRTSEINRLAADPDFLTQILKEMGS